MIIDDVPVYYYVICPVCGVYTDIAKHAPGDRSVTFDYFDPNWLYRHVSHGRPLFFTDDVPQEYVYEACT